MKKEILIFIVCATSLFACKKDKNPEVNDDKLTLQRTNYTGNELRINGYYYNVWSGGFYDLRVFYGNGTVKNIGAPSGGTTMLQADNHVSAMTPTIMGRKSGWGVFIINGSSIKLEEWRPDNTKLVAITREGTILNDTTFKFTQVYRLVNAVKTEQSTIDETFYFRQYSPKPDSTNQYIP